MTTRADLLQQKFANFVGWIKGECGQHHGLLDLAEGQSPELKFLFVRECVVPRRKALELRKRSALWEVAELLERQTGFVWPEAFQQKLDENEAVREKLFRYLECFAALVTE